MNDINNDMNYNFNFKNLKNKPELNTEKKQWHYSYYKESRSNDLFTLPEIVGYIRNLIAKIIYDQQSGDNTTNHINFYNELLDIENRDYDILDLQNGNYIDPRELLDLLDNKDGNYLEFYLSTLTEIEKFDPKNANYKYTEKCFTTREILELCRDAELETKNENKTLDE